MHPFSSPATGDVPSTSDSRSSAGEMSREGESTNSALRPHNSGPRSHHKQQMSTTTTQRMCGEYFTTSVAPSSSSVLFPHHNNHTTSSELGKVLERVSELTLRVDCQSENDPDCCAFTPNSNSNKSNNSKRNDPCTPTSLQKRFSWSSLEHYHNNNNSCFVMKRSRRGSCSTVLVESAPHLPSSPDLEDTTRIPLRHPAPFISPSIIRIQQQAPSAVMMPPPPLHLPAESQPMDEQRDPHCTATTSSSSIPPPPPPVMPLMSTPDLVPRRITAPSQLKMRSSDTTTAFLPIL